MPETRPRHRLRVLATLPLIASTLLAGCLGAGVPSPPAAGTDGTGAAEATGTDRFSGAWHNVTKAEYGIVERLAEPVADRTGDPRIELRDRRNYTAFDATVTFRWTDTAIETPWRFVLSHIIACPERFADTDSTCSAWGWTGQGTSPITVRFDETDIAVNQSENVTREVIIVRLARPTDWPVPDHSANAQRKITWEAVVDYR